MSQSKKIHTRAIHIYLLLSVIVVNRCSRNMKRADDAEQEDRCRNRLGEHLSHRSGRNGIGEKLCVSKELNFSLSFFLSLAAGSAVVCLFDRYREIRERKIVGLARARQVFWWRRDAQRPSYSRLVHSLLASSCFGCATPNLIVTQYNNLTR